jgi:capsular polysaccharide biosynthesis protein
MTNRDAQSQQTPGTPPRRELTESPGAAVPPTDGFPGRLVLALLDDAKDLLSAVGVRLSIVSIDEERAVFVSEPANGGHVTVAMACDLSRRALTQVADSLPGPTTELVELRCGRRSEWPCTFSLEWTQGQTPTAGTNDVPSLEMLIGGEEHGPARRTEVAAAVATEPTARLRQTPVTAPTGGGRTARGKTARVEAARVEAASVEAARVETGAVETTPVETGNGESADDEPAVEETGKTGPRWPSFHDVTTRLHRPSFVLPPWFRRRWWLLALCILAGTAGGALARSAQTPMYSASSEIVVATGAGEKGPGDANDAIALALTDASILPSDQALLNNVSQDTGVSTRVIADHLSASVEAGTSVILVSYDAPSPSAAIKGANAVGRTITSHDEEISAIPNGSLSLVQLATGASASGMLFTYGLPLGALLGLLIGLVFVVGIERADPRADDVEDLAQATGTAATAYPGPVALAELEQLLDRASDGAPAATLVPLSDFEVAHVIALRNGLDLAADHQSLAIDMAGPVGSLDDRLTRGEGPTVLVVRTSARLRSIKESVQRLEMLGRRPVWAVLAVGAPPGTSP